MSRSRTFLLALLSSILLITICNFHFHFDTSPPPYPATLPPANSTLGFGAIIAVSHTRSPRRPSLLWAANLTDLDIVIPPQPEWTISDVQNFRAKSGSSISNGSAKAWLGHLNALEWFLSTPHTTALIIEDDTDFDISIRHSQIPLLAAATRSILNASNHDYWPPASTWDLLYPGHCDDLISPTAYLFRPHISYHDPTVPQHTLLHPDTKNFLHSLNLPSSTRFVHRSYWPFCTFAYAVTRYSASKILTTKAREPEGGISAYDVALLTACRDLDWRCWSVSPEVFHHEVGGSEIGKVDDGTAFVEGLEELDGEKDRGRMRGRGTWNLGCGARHAQLWVDERDEGGRKAVKDVVRGMIGRGRGECPIDALMEESGWTGCEWGECGAQS